MLARAPLSQSGFLPRPPKPSPDRPAPPLPLPLEVPPGEAAPLPVPLPAVLLSVVIVCLLFSSAPSPQSSTQEDDDGPSVLPPLVGAAKVCMLTLLLDRGVLLQLNCKLKSGRFWPCSEGYPLHMVEIWQIPFNANSFDFDGCKIIICQGNSIFLRMGTLTDSWSSFLTRSSKTSPPEPTSENKNGVNWVMGSILWGPHMIHLAIYLIQLV